VKTLKSIQFMVILLSTSLIMACGLGAAPNANPSAPAVAPVATNNSQSSGANSIPAIAGNCTLLSKDEVGKVLAQAVDEVRDPSPNHTLCVYQTKNLILELTFLHQFGGFLNSVKYMQETRSNNIGDSPLDVPGLGDEAFYHGASAYRMLFVRKGDTVYTFGVRNVTADQSISSPENAQAMEKALAELLLSRLP
jgi:hypothetical protein